jgi:oligosaccharide repeat unit polymerase
VLLVVSIAVLIIFVSRGFLVQAGLQAFFLYLYSSRKGLTTSYMLKTAAIFVVAVMLFGAWGEIRSGNKIFLDVMQVKPQYQSIPTLLLWSDAYLSLPLVNMVTIINKIHYFTFGSATLASSLPPIMIKLLNLKTFSNIYGPIVSLYPSPLNNMATAAAIPYLDFGWAGIGFFYLLLGVVSGMINCKAIASGELRTQVINSIILSSIALCFFWNMILNITVISEITIVLIIFSFRFR